MVRILSHLQKQAAALLTFIGLCISVANAQNTSSVSGPTVTAGERETEYRFGWIPDGDQDSFGHRFDYGFSFNDRTSLKIFVNLEDVPRQDLRFDNINAEYLIELTPEDAPVWKTGIRFDARLADGSDPERLRLNWLNQWQLTDALRARAQFISTREFGAAATRSLEFELRSSLIWKLDARYDLALLSFAELGTFDDFGLDGRVQQAGPALTWELGNGYEWTAGTLFGLSDAAPENDIRFWITKSF